MTPERLADIRKRLAAVTPGQWATGGGLRALTEAHVVLLPGEWCIAECERTPEQLANARFIAWAPRDVDDLTTALDAAFQREWDIHEAAEQLRDLWKAWLKEDTVPALGSRLIILVDNLMGVMEKHREAVKT